MEYRHRSMKRWHSMPLIGELAVRIVTSYVARPSAVFPVRKQHFFTQPYRPAKLRQSRNKYSESIHEMLDEPRRLIISILCGNELVNIASAVNMTGILLMFIRRAGGDLDQYRGHGSVVLLIGEVTPKPSRSVSGQILHRTQRPYSSLAGSC